MLKICSIGSFILKGGIVFFLLVAVAVAQFESNPLSLAIDNTEYDVETFFPGWLTTSSSSTVGGDSAISSVIADDDAAIMSIDYLDTFGLGGNVSFDWKMTETSLYDELSFIIFNESGSRYHTETLTSEEDWTSFSIDLPNTDVILVWGYYEDGQFEDATQGNEFGRGWVDNVKITQNGSSSCTTFTSSLNSALDNNQYEIISADFICQEEESTFGGSAAQSGEETIRLATSSMSATVDGPVDLIFDWKIDAGAEDLFELSIDSETIEILSGSTEWATRRMSVPAGEHLIRWDYRRFSQTQSNSNSGFVDYLRTAEFTDIKEGGPIVISPIINLLLDEE